MNKRFDSLWAVLDQAATSGGNFAIVALGAHFLPLTEQSRLVYVYTAYIAAVLVNASAVFAAAPVVRKEIEDTAGYRSFLLLLQGKLALGFSLCATVLLGLGGGLLDWEAGGGELVALAFFLLVQQLADFQRRAAYVFSSAKYSALSSGFIFFARLGLVIAFAPHSAREMFMLLAVSALPVAIVVFRGFHFGRGWAFSTRHWQLARWNVMSVPLVWTMLHSPVYFAGSLAGPVAAAVFAALRSLGTVANVLLELLETYVPVWLLQRIEKMGDKQSGLRRMFGLLLMIGGGFWGLGMIAIFAWGEELIGLTLGRNYLGYSDVLKVLWLGNGLYFIGRLAGVVQRVTGRSVVEFSGAVAGVAALLFGIPLVMQHGALGAAWMLVIVQVAIVTAQVISVRLRQEKRLV